MHGRSRRKALTKRIELPEDDYARLLKLAESAAGLQVENRHLVQELQNSGTMLWRLRREAEDTEERLHQLWMDTRSYREAVKIAPRRVGGPAGAPPGAIGDTAKPDAAAEPGLGNAVVSRWNEQAPGTARRKGDRMG